MRGRITAGWALLGALVTVAAPPSLVGQGWIEAPPLRGSGFAVEKTRSEVRVRIEGRVAEVEVSEWFLNEGSRVAEGHYLYPLPGEAAFQGFSLFQGDAELRGEIMDAERARRIYEEIVRRRADPALIELAGHGLLRARVFPIEPGEERKVSLRFTQVLERAGGSLHFRYAGAVRAAPDRGRDDTPRARPLAEPVETSFELVAEAGDHFLAPFSPTHELDSEREGNRLVVRMDDELVGRLSLFLPLAGDALGLSVATHRPPGEDGYVMLTLSPGIDDGRPEPRDVTVVLDVSGSMSGEKIGQAKAALRGVLATLSREDRFRLVAFSNAVRVLDDDWRSATGAALDDARAWVERLAADGGTNIGAALDEAFRLESPRGRLPVVIFLTDGLPSVGEESPERLADRAEVEAGRARVFAFGVGHDVNTHLLDRLGEAGRGSTDYVQPGENVERAVGLVAAKIRHPVLTDLELAGAPVRITELYPARLPDVFAGEELVLFGRYDGAGEGEVRVRGERRGAMRSFVTQAAFGRREMANAYIPRLWASRKLGHLMRQLWTEGETPSLVAEIRTLALRYGLPSPYTAYLVQEPGRVALRPDLVDALRASPALARPVAARPVAPASRTATAAAASGAGAVRRAEQARGFRDAASTESLREAEEALADRWAASGESAPVRAVAGRLFVEEDGVWMDRAPGADDVQRVRVFSGAWFALVDALPEVAPVLRELGAVRVSGHEVDLVIGSRGVEELDEREIDALVRRFRGPEGAP